MKKMVQLLAFCLGACIACAQGTLQVLPSGYANVEGNSASAAMFNTNFSQVLQVFDASHFASLGGLNGRIDSVAFRIDAGTNQTFNGIWPGLAVGLATTTRSSDSLSPVYTDNFGPDGMSLFSGSLLIRATNSGVSPRMFEILVQFTQPFFYDPSKGNLSLIVAASSGSLNLLLDAQNDPADGIGRVYGPQGQNFGTVDSMGFITRFGITPVPEPTTIPLFLLGFATFGWFMRRGRKSASPDFS
jgi:hypothetical protein